VKTPLRVLPVEDNEDDWLLLRRTLDKGGFEVHSVRVQTAHDMREAMRQEWDLVISDFHMPTFDALQALAVLKELGRDLPFIIASGTIGEEAAVAALKAGAHDFVLKDQLARFLPAVNRELRDAELRRERRQMAVALSESESRYRRIAETAQEGIWMLDSAGCTT
jgi:two-component system cell cycle sensor histidine kinase/response regulator CckA